LKPVLAKSYAGALATEWALTILKSTVSLAPRFVIFHLLDRLATPSHGVDVQGLYLALSVGICKAFELWVDSMLRWVTESKLRIPILATLSALVH